MVGRLRDKSDETAILIDTPGLNPFNRAEIADMRRFIDGVEAAAVLVLPAGGDADEAIEIATACTAIGARQLVCTRIDAARRFGGLLAAADAGALAFSEISVSPYVSDGLIRLDSLALSKLLMHATFGRPVPTRHGNVDAMNPSTAKLRAPSVGPCAGPQYRDGRIGQGRCGQDLVRHQPGPGAGQGRQARLLFDGDLGLANVDVQLGLMPERDLATVVSGKITLFEAIMPVEERGLRSDRRPFGQRRSGPADQSGRARGIAAQPDRRRPAL